MRLNNFQDIALKANLSNSKKLLFDFKFGTITFKCLLLTKNRVLMISNINASIGHSVTIDKDNNIPSFVPHEFYGSVVNELKTLSGKNKISFMWKMLDDFLSTLNVEKIGECTNNEVGKIIATLKTKDIKYDPDGEKPYFETWVRNNIKHCSNENNKKTARYFGINIANICRRNNISSRWSDVIQKNSYSFLSLEEVENELDRQQ